MRSMPINADASRKMNPLTRTVRRYPITSFGVLACLFGWSIFLAAGLGFGSQPDNMPLGPLLAALIVASFHGRDSLSAYGRRLRTWRAPPVFYVVAVLTPIAVHVINVVTNHALGAPLPSAAQLSHWPDVASAFVIMLVMVGIGEEAGWTAFAAPLLLRRQGLWLTWAALASLRILWHLPLMLTGEMPWFMGIVGNAAFQMILLQLFVLSRSWLPAAVWHATLNAVGGAFLFTMVSGADKERLGQLLAVAYAVLAVTIVGVRSLHRRAVESGVSEDVLTAADLNAEHTPAQPTR
jgi:CAAX protease family protein